MRPQAEEALLEAARTGDLATLKRLLKEGVNVNAGHGVSAAPPRQPPPHPPALPPSALAIAAPAACPALTAAAHCACGAAAAPP